jgi:hypothetical protein
MTRNNHYYQCIFTQLATRHKDAHTVMETTILDSNKIEEMLKDLTSAHGMDSDDIVTKVIDNFTTEQNRPVPVTVLKVNVQTSVSSCRCPIRLLQIKNPRDITKTNI